MIHAVIGISNNFLYLHSSFFPPTTRAIAASRTLPLFEDGDVGVGVFPEREEILVGG